MWWRWRGLRRRGERVQVVGCGGAVQRCAGSASALCVVRCALCGSGSRRRLRPGARCEAVQRVQTRRFRRDRLLATMWDSGEGEPFAPSCLRTLAATRPSRCERSRRRLKRRGRVASGGWAMPNGGRACDPLAGGEARGVWGPAQVRRWPDPGVGAKSNGRTTDLDGGTGQTRSPGTALESGFWMPG